MLDQVEYRKLYKHALEWHVTTNNWYCVEWAALHLKLLLTAILSFQSVGRSHDASIADKHG